MKTKHLLMMAASLIAAFSCEKEKGNGEPQVEDGFVTIKITTSSEATKTILGEPEDGMRKISWRQGDAIRIIYGSGTSDWILSEAEVDGETTTFTANVPQGATTLWAVYPAAALDSFSEDALTVNIPAVQDGSFASANIAVAKSNTENASFTFKNVVSYILTDISSTGIGRVTVSAEGQALSGKIPVSFDENGDINLGTYSETSASVMASGIGSGTCSIAVLPGLDFSTGVRVTFSDAEGEEVSHVNMKKEHVLKKGEVLSTGALDEATTIAYYVTPDGTGTKDGSSFSNAWDTDALIAWLKMQNPEISGVKSPDAPYMIYLADGTYTMTESVATAAKNGRDINFVSVGKKAVFTSNESVSGRMLYFSIPGKLTFQDITFSGHTVNGSGAALYFNNPSTGTQETVLNGCTFKDNTNESGLNAALVLANNGINTLTDCTFQNNTAAGAPAINIDRENTVVTMAGCAFKENRIVKCAEDKDAGALVIGNGTVTASGCTFDSNVVEAEAFGGGAAVWIAQTSEKPIVFKDHCTFKNNKLNNTTGRGAAVYITKGSNILFENCTFTANECAAGSTTSYGGAVCLGNFAKHRRGDVNVTFNTCTFDANQVEGAGQDVDFARGGGAIFMSQYAGTTASCTLENCTIQNHVLNNRCGGGIYAESGTLHIVGGIFSGNDIRRTYTEGDGKVRGQGGALEIENAQVSITGNTVFSNNISGNAGGAVMLSSGYTGTLEIDGASFLNNKSETASGGAIRIDAENGGKFTFKNVTFEGNSAYTGGGAISHQRNQDLDLIRCTFNNNEANSLGGALYVIGLNNAKNSVKVEDCTFTGNHTSDSGGAIDVSNEGSKSNPCYSNITVLNSTFKNNYSVAKGGAIDSKTSGICTIDGCLFEGNYLTKQNSGWGAGLNLEHGRTDETERGTAIVKNSRFIGNYTNVDGSGSDPRGGAIGIGVAAYTYKNYIDVRIDKCYFKDNHARQAGAIRAWDGQNGNISLFLNACSFEGNHAVADFGKCVWVYDCKEFGMNNCSFRNNYSDINAALVRLCWVNLSGTKSVLCNNTIVGQMQKKANDTDNYGNGGCLVRIEGSADASYDFINNIIAANASGTCYSVISYATGNASYNLYSNKLSPITNFTVTHTDDHNGSNWKGLSSYFGKLEWTSNSTGGQEYKSGWTWDGTLATGSPATMNTRGDVKSKIQAANSDFYTWLQSVDGIDKDQQGNARGSADTDAIWPGAYQLQ